LLSLGITTCPITKHTDNHTQLKEDLTLITSIPAVGSQLSHHLLAVMRNHHFDSAEKLAAYLGLVPVQRRSGISILGRSRISKAGLSILEQYCTWLL
jgi:transposase